MKAVSDKVLTTIVAMILAVFALIIIWVFLSSSMPGITTAIQKFSCGICKAIAGPLKGMCGEC